MWGAKTPIPPALIAPSGNGIAGGEIFDMECLSYNSGEIRLSPSVIIQPTTSCEYLGTSQLNDDYSTRDLICVGQGVCDIDINVGGKVFARDSGGAARLVDTLDFYGSSVVYSADVIQITSTGGEMAIQYALRYDQVDATTAYKGEANPGTTDNEALWRIARLTFVGEDVTIAWAAGSAAFDKVWTNRASLSYT